MRRLHWGIALTLACATSSMGDTISDGVSAVGVMNDGQGHSRILFTINGLDDASQEGNLAVGRATVTFTFSGIPEDRSLPLRIYPVTSPWIPGAVDWSVGWENPGGDIDPELYTRAEVSLSQAFSTVAFDVTRLVKEVIEDDQVFHGFLVTLDPEIGIGIPTQDVTRFEGLSLAALEMDAIKIGSLPPSAVEDGSRPARLRRGAHDVQGR